MINLRRIYIFSVVHDIFNMIFISETFFNLGDANLVDGNFPFYPLNSILNTIHHLKHHLNKILLVLLFNYCYY